MSQGLHILLPGSEMQAAIATSLKISKTKMVNQQIKNQSCLVNKPISTFSEQIIKSRCYPQKLTIKGPRAIKEINYHFYY